MNLKLDNDELIYIALFDIPLKSNILGFIFIMEVEKLLQVLNNIQK